MGETALAAAEKEALVAAVRKNVPEKRLQVLACREGGGAQIRLVVRAGEPLGKEVLEAVRQSCEASMHCRVVVSDCHFLDDSEKKAIFKEAVRIWDSA